MFRHILPAVVAVVIAACGKDAEPEPVIPEGPLPIEQTTFAAELAVDLTASTKTGTGLYYRDIVVGDGAVVTPGQRAEVYYDGRLANGTPFDASKPGAPYSFTVGASQVIAGWDEGVAGMRVGSKRQLIIPPTLGYGPRANGPIPANSILVFTVEVLSAQ